MDRPPLIVSDGLTKAYGPIHALRDLSMEVRQGEVYGLLGPNGSGKTTTIRLWLGLMKPTRGRASIFGLDCWRGGLQVRRLVSYLPGELRMPGSMSGLGVLKFLSGLRDGEGLDRAAAIAEKVMRLDLRRKVRKYSTGMKQKLALAQAFADPVDVLILDEPTSALDPSARVDVMNLIREAKALGQTVVFSGHVLSEIEAVCDRVAILRRGRLVHVEDMHARRRLRMLLVRFAGDSPPPFPEELGLSIRKPEGAALLLEHRGELGPLLRWLATVPVEDLAIGTEDLHSLYNEYHGPDAVDEEEDFTR
ncbi:ABC transporter ATP-binding protein [Planctomyces sp. SH-PL62]|uniref:ABC transporter ATP-binding protein n=1 Tax=Planctomyces sp. SH-PL62 TaxID=1636152 RepID=UPI00078C2FAF|nr:ABC transporter ATP-binding protein [Planctomyces sp. SH-PL62]AMV37651.1 putative ABC transporter ATP-binding protein YxlF [Planctomyces sp. SH-PL62]